MNELEQVGILSLFSTPIVRTNIGRDFTETELQLLLTDLPYHKDEEGMQNHRSKDVYLFDTFAEELKDIKSFCQTSLKNYLEQIEGANTDLAGLRITQSWLNITKPSESHHLHHHSNSYLSAVLYISCLPKDYINIEKAFNEIKSDGKARYCGISVGIHYEKGIEIITASLLLISSSSR